MGTPRSLVAIAVAALLAAACGLHPGEAWNRTDGQAGGVGTGGATVAATNEDATDQSAQGLCPSSSSRLAGTHAAGDPCSSPNDCVSTCCDCGTGSASWLAASCVAGRCVESLTSCSRTQAQFCGGGGGTIIVAPGGQSCSAGGGTPCESCIAASCCAASLACDANAACVALESCDATCSGDAACRARCYETNAGGAPDLQALDACVASACGAACEP
jgi:hypothetical protein